MTISEASTASELAGWSTNRTISTNAVHAPAVTEVSDGMVWYSPLGMKQSTGRPDLLRGFLALEDKSDAAVVAFARKWGCLGLCPHGLPGYHGCTVEWPKHLRCAGKHDELWGESIDNYRKLSKLFVTALGLGAGLRNDDVGQPADWDFFNDSISGPDFPGRPLFSGTLAMFDSTAEWDARKKKRVKLDSARLEFQVGIRRLIELADIRPRFVWSDSWRMVLDSGRSLSNLPAILLLQLLPAMADVDGYATCSSCHRPYIPIRKPDPTRRNYCEKCGIKAAWRDSKRKQRELERADRHVEES